MNKLLISVLIMAGLYGISKADDCTNYGTFCHYNGKVKTVEITPTYVRVFFSDATSPNQVLSGASAGSAIVDLTVTANKDFGKELYALALSAKANSDQILLEMKSVNSTLNLMEICKAQLK